MKNIDEGAWRDAEDSDYSTMHLTFRLDGKLYGITIENVIEILKIQPATKLPELPDYSKGVINLRGRVIPLIDVNMRFGKPEKEYTDRTCIIIVDVDGLHTGLIVDTVEEVRDIDRSLTSALPNSYADNPEEYITRVAKLDKNLALLLDVRALVSPPDM